MGLDKTAKGYDSGTFTAGGQSVFWAYRNLQTLTMTNFPLYAPMVHRNFSRIQKQLIGEAQKTIKTYELTKKHALIAQNAHQVTSQSLYNVHKLTNQILTKMAANISEKYKFEGA